MAAKNTCIECGMFLTLQESQTGVCSSCRDNMKMPASEVQHAPAPARKRTRSIKGWIVLGIVVWAGVALAVNVIVKSPEQRLLAEYAPRAAEIRELVSTLPETNAPALKPAAELTPRPDAMNTRIASAESILNPADERERIRDDWGIELATRYDRDRKSFDVDRKRQELRTLFDFRYLAVVRFVDWKQPAVNGSTFTPGGGTLRIDLIDLEQKRVVASMTTSADQSRERLILFGSNAAGYVSAEQAVAHNLKSLVSRQVRRELNSALGTEFKIQ